MLNLIVKDFKLLFGLKGSKLSRFLTYLFLVILSGVLIFVETIIFTNIINKIKVYDNAVDALFNIFLFIIAILLTFVCLFTARKLFFNEQDNMQLQTFPISNTKKIISKLLFLTLIMYFFNLLFALPLFIAYGISFNKMMFYFYGSIYYPLFIYIFQAGVSLILLIPFNQLHVFLKKHIVVQIFLVIVLGLALSLGYGYVLNLFVNLVTNSGGNSLFTKERIDLITKIGKNLFPVNLLAEVFVTKSAKNTQKIFTYLAFSGGLFIIGVTILNYFYNRFTYQQNYTVDRKKKHQHIVKVTTPIKALIKKELIIMFRNSNLIITFTSLIFIEPFLNFFIVRSINTIFSSGSLLYFSLVIPNLAFSTDLLLVLLISAMVSMGGTNYISNEDKNVRMMKTYPVSAKKQLGIKLLIPFVTLSIFSFFSACVLCISKQISFINSIYLLVLNIMFIGLLNLISLYEELKLNMNGSRSTLLSTLATYLVPLMIFAIFLLSSYFRINNIYAFLITIFAVSLLFLPFLINGKVKFRRWFIEMEVTC